MIFKVALIVASALSVTSASASTWNDISGTYKLVVDERKIVSSGELIRNPHPDGYISYDRGGRMLVLIVRTPRPKPRSATDVTDAQRISLFKTMTAYAGTYKFNGSTVTHHIDISWNGAWTGTTEVRSVKRQGDLLVYTAKPFPYPTDGRLSIATLVWKKLK